MLQGIADRTGLPLVVKCESCGNEFTTKDAKQTECNACFCGF